MEMIGSEKDIDKEKSAKNCKFFWGILLELPKYYFFYSITQSKSKYQPKLKDEQIDFISSLEALKNALWLFKFLRCTWV